MGATIITILFLLAFMFGVFCGIVLCKKTDPVSAMAARMLDKLERYDFECEAGPLSNCLEFIRLKRLFK